MAELIKMKTESCFIQFLLVCDFVIKFRCIVEILVAGKIDAFSNANSPKSCRFGLAFTLKSFHRRHKMMTILKTV